VSTQPAKCDRWCPQCHGTGSILIEINDGGRWYDMCPNLEAQLGKKVAAA